MYLIDLAQAIKRLYINMVDLEHEGHQGKVDTVQQFPSEVTLNEYTRITGRFYQKDLVPRKSLLKFLQRHILDSQPEKTDKDRVSNHKKKGEKQKGVESDQLQKRRG